MKLPVIYVFTHDSVAVGEDGPTHQPVEQLASLRAMPNVLVLRPCDANETADAWCQAMKTNDRPIAMLFSRQKLPVLPRRQTAGGLARGAYVLSDCDSTPEIILLASGAEVHQALGAQQILKEKGAAARVVSMPSWELFEQQSEEYRREGLPPEVTARLAVEAGATMGWERYVGDRGDIIGIDGFGASAPGGEVLARYGFTDENVAERALALLRN
jgi:transketolase